MESEAVVEAGQHGRPLIVTVHNEDAGGKPFKIPGEPDTLVGSIVDQFYIDLGSPREEGDRLYCLANGSDVFASLEQRLGDYAETACKPLEWGFARSTGGA